jgi:hypothetical protein
MDVGYWQRVGSAGTASLRRIERQFMAHRREFFSFIYDWQGRRTHTIGRAEAEVAAADGAVREDRLFRLDRAAGGVGWAVDLSDDKLGLARQLGATDTFNPSSPDAADEIRSATNGGVEFAFEMADSVRAMELAYKIIRRGGTTVTAGLPPPTHTFALPLSPMTFCTP